MRCATSGLALALLFYGWHPPSCPCTGTACVAVLQHPLAQRALPGTLLRAGVGRGDAEPTAQGTASIRAMQQWDTMQGHPSVLPSYSSLLGKANLGQIGKGLKQISKPVLERLGLCADSRYQWMKAAASKNGLRMEFESLIYLIIPGIKSFPESVWLWKIFLKKIKHHEKCKILPSLVSNQSQNCRTVWGGRDFRDHLIPTPLPWGGTPSTKPGCSQPHPTWPWTQLGEFQLWCHLDIYTIPSNSHNVRGSTHSQEPEPHADLT